MRVLLFSSIKIIQSWGSEEDEIFENVVKRLLKGISIHDPFELSVIEDIVEKTKANNEYINNKNVKLNINKFFLLKKYKKQFKN